MRNGIFWLDCCFVPTSHSAEHSKYTSLGKLLLSHWVPKISVNIMFHKGLLVYHSWSYLLGLNILLAIESYLYSEHVLSNCCSLNHLSVQLVYFSQFCNFQVDLGAAANFGRESVQSPITVKNATTEDLLNDDFDPRADETKTNLSKTEDDLSDLVSAFKGNSVQGSTEEFADFTSAFNTPSASAQDADFAQFMPVSNFASFNTASTTGEKLFS